MPERIICLIAGESGSGKSFFVANLKQARIYDTDLGGGLAYADARIARNQSERIQIGSYPEILEDLKNQALAGRLKDRVTIAIDHLSTLQQEAVIRHNPDFLRDFGTAGDKGAREWRKIREFCRNQDFNLVCTAHLKAKWEQEKVTGVTSEASKNIEGDMHIVLHLRRSDKYPSNAWVQKWRRDPEDPRGLIPSVFPLTIEAFEKLAGPGMFSPREPVALASLDQLKQISHLLEVCKLPDGTVEKWLKKAGIDDFQEMASTDIAKCIAYIETLLVGSNGEADKKPAKRKAGV